MTPRPPCPPTRSRTGGRRTLAAHRDEFHDPYAPGGFDLFDDAVQGSHFAEAEPGGRTAQPPGEGVVDGWDDLEPEAA